MGLQERRIVRYFRKNKGASIQQAVTDLGISESWVRDVVTRRGLLATGMVVRAAPVDSLSVPRPQQPGVQQKSRKHKPEQNQLMEHGKFTRPPDNPLDRAIFGLLRNHLEASYREIALEITRRFKYYRTASSVSSLYVMICRVSKVAHKYGLQRGPSDRKHLMREASHLG